jgi:clan AA aspartic protease
MALLNHLAIRSKSVGLIYADIILFNSIDVGLAQQGSIPSDNIRKMNVNALVDTGAIMLTINDAIADQLGLMIHDSAEVELADGTHIKRNLVGPVTIRFKNRSTICSAIVLPGASEVLLGAIPLEGMDVIIDPLSQQLDVHPDRPYLAQMKIK